MPTTHLPLAPWVTPTVVAIAQGIVADNAWYRLPVLADALENASFPGNEYIGMFNKSPFDLGDLFEFLCLLIAVEAIGPRIGLHTKLLAELAMRPGYYGYMIGVGEAAGMSLKFEPVFAGVESAVEG